MVVKWPNSKVVIFFIGQSLHAYHILVKYKVTKKLVSWVDGTNDSSTKRLLPWSLTFVCFSSYDLVASPFAVVLCRVGNYYWESRCTMVVIKLIGMGFDFPIFHIFLSLGCLRIVLLAIVDLYWPLLSFVSLYHPSSFIALSRPALACIGLHWLVLACIGLCRPSSENGNFWLCSVPKIITKGRGWGVRKPQILIR